jgi:hypothetical protein
MSDDLRIVGYRVESALLELSELLRAQILIRIVHRFREPGVIGCLRGEEIVAAYCVFRHSTCQLRVPLSGRLLN